MLKLISNLFTLITQVLVILIKHIIYQLTKNIFSQTVQMLQKCLDIQVLKKLQQIVNLTEEFTPNVFFTNKDIAHEYLKKLHYQTIYESYVINYIDQIHVAFLQNIQTGKISNFVSETKDIKELIDDYQQTIDQGQLTLEKLHAFTKSGKDLGFKSFNPNDYEV